MIKVNLTNTIYTFRYTEREREGSWGVTGEGRTLWLNVKN